MSGLPNEQDTLNHFKSLNGIKYINIKFKEILCKFIKYPKCMREDIYVRHGEVREICRLDINS